MTEIDAFNLFLNAIATACVFGVIIGIFLKHSL